MPNGICVYNKQVLCQKKSLNNKEYNRKEWSKKMQKTKTVG
jgi:hypothetical protein